METSVLAPADLPADWVDAPWRVTVPALAPRRLAALADDARWSIRFVVAQVDGGLAALTPICRPRFTVMADQDYDLVRLVNRPDLSVPTDASRWLFVGGCRDLRSGLLTSHMIAPADAPALRRSVAQQAFAVARADDLVGVAAYVADADAEACLSALNGHAVSVQVGAAATIRVVPGTSEDFVASLASDRRRKTRRDWRLFEQAGLHSVILPAAEAIRDGAALVCAVKRRYGVADDPRLAAFRLRRWLAAGAGEYVAFAVLDADGRLVAMSFALRCGDAIEIHEIGMIEDEGLRHLGYLEAGFYAPIRYAQQHRCAVVELGMDSLEPKRHRGASLTPLRLVLATDAEPRDAVRR